MRFLLSALALTASLAAQSPFPPITLNTFEVGGATARQEGVGLARQYLQCRTPFSTILAPAATDPASENRVRQPGLLHFLSWTNSPGAAGGSYLPVLVVNFYTGALPGPFAPLLLPGAAVGNDEVFVDITGALVTLPSSTEQFLSVSGMHDMFVFTLALPDPAVQNIAGTVFTAQAFRVDPSDGLIYLSDESHARVGL